MLGWRGQILEVELERLDSEVLDVSGERFFIPGFGELHPGYVGRSGGPVFKFFFGNGRQRHRGRV